jgi:dTDP-4-dehydrorhamnose 3,5-epimerase
MRATQTAINGVLLLEPQVFGDARGFFLESYNEKAFAQATGLNVHFVQDNHSRSQRNVLRGMHFQVNKPQGKLVRVVSGEVFDVAVDIRPKSPTYGKWAKYSRLKTRSNYGSLPGLLMDFSCYRKAQIFYIKPPTITTRHPSDASLGMIRLWAFIGHLAMKHPKFHRKMPWAWHFKCYEREHSSCNKRYVIPRATWGGPRLGRLWPH